MGLLSSIVSSVSGPPPIESFDWSNLYHKTTLASCLVKGVYTMEKDRQKKRQDSATPWYKTFGFTLEKPLIDTSNDSIYAAVFKNGNEYQNSPNSEVPPRYVIALRGTIIRPKTLIGDIENNIRCAIECLHRGSKFVQAIQEIESIVKIHGHKAVWLTGHSLGASLALLVGKNMAMRGSPVEAFIFNPVISLIPIDQSIDNENLKFVVRLGMDIFKGCIASIANIAIALDQNKDDQEVHRYKNLASWRPHLFVNPLDRFCSEYIGNFEQRGKMAEWGLEAFKRFASRYSIRSMLFGGGENCALEYLHFLPSALMMVNKLESNALTENHRIDQWWDPNLVDHSTYDPY